MIKTVLADGQKLGAVALRSPFEVPEGRGAVQANDAGEPVYVAEVLLGGRVTGATARECSPGSARVRVYGQRPSTDTGLVVLEGEVTVTVWAMGRGAGARSALTLTVGKVRAARAGEAPRFADPVPVYLPERTHDKEVGHEIPLDLMYLSAVDRGGNALHRFGIDVMTSPSGPWKVDGVGQIDCATAPPSEWVGQLIRPVGLSARWYVPDAPSNYDKAALYLAAERFELAKAPKPSKADQPEPVPAS